MIGRPAIEELSRRRRFTAERHGLGGKRQEPVAQGFGVRQQQWQFCREDGGGLRRAFIAHRRRHRAPQSNLIGSGEARIVEFLGAVGVAGEQRRDRLQADHIGIIGKASIIGGREPEHRLRLDVHAERQHRLRHRNACRSAIPGGRGRRSVGRRLQSPPQPFQRQRGKIVAAAEEVGIGGRGRRIRRRRERNLSGGTEIENETRSGDVEGEPVRYRLDGHSLPCRQQRVFRRRPRDRDGLARLRAACRPAARRRYQDRASKRPARHRRPGGAPIRRRARAG